MTTFKIPQTQLPSGESVPAFGLGTWRMAESRSRRADEIAALQQGFELGLTLIDTAEMYASGGAEELVAEALGDHRKELFLVSKVLPENASRKGTQAACERSLKRLKTDYIDLYLLHWPGSHPLSETVAGMLALVEAGKIRHWGVSNLDLGDMKELVALKGGQGCATNQVLYNLSRRGIEHDLMPWQRQRKMTLMAYSPIEQGRIVRHAALKTIAARHGATPAQVALAWLLRQERVITIPKAGTAEHARENYASLGVTLKPQDLDELDRAFPPPKSAQPLAIL
jgi:diketogulonate reductase-like aldo/keto reductase